MVDNLKDLPPLPGTVDPALRETLNRWREAIQVLRANRGDPLDAAVTWRSAIGNGLAIQNGNGFKPTAAGSAGPPGVSGPPGPAGPSYAPDLTPPPTVSGLAVSAGLTNIIVEFTAPTYTQGHGNQRTDIYAVKRDPASGSPMPTFGDASVVDSVSGSSPIIAIASDLNVEWHVWAKFVSVDGVASTSPAGGTNGVVATTGKIGNADLGALIVEAGNLANGSVSASKVAASAIDQTKFASGIEPVTVVSTIPGSLVTKTIFDTSNGKLYRWNGAAYTAGVAAVDVGSGLTGTQIAAGTITALNIAANTITASKIAANTITTGLIAAGAVNAAQIAAGAITTDKLLVTGQGASLLDDPMFTDPSAWGVSSGAQGTFVTGITDLPVGTTALASIAGTTTNPWNSNLIPVDQAKNYRLQTYVKQSAGAAATNYLLVAWFDAVGSLLVSNVAQPGGAGSPAGWSNGTFSYFSLIGAVAPTTWTRYTSSFGPDETNKIPTNAKYMRVGALLNYGSAAAAVVQISGFTVTEKADYDLIVDGSIIASKLAANSIAVGTAAIENGAIVNAMIGNAVIDDAKIANVSAAKLTAGSIAVGQYIQSSGYSPGSTGWKITGNGNAEFGAASIRGQLTAAQIGAGTIDASKMNVSSLSAITANLGNVSGGQYTTGAFTGYSWPAAGAGGGSYLGPSGLLLGSANDGKYFQVTSAGDIHSPGFTVIGGNATFNGTLTVGMASAGAASGSVASTAGNAAGTTSINTGGLTVLTYTSGGGDVLVTFNVNMAVMCNTNTPCRVVFTPMIGGAVYAPASHYPEYELPLTQSNPMALAAGSGATHYNWGATLNFSTTIQVPAAVFGVGAKLIGFYVTAYFLNASGGGNTITGSSIYAEGVATAREFKA